jgi:hypothetical protein
MSSTVFGDGGQYCFDCPDTADTGDSDVSWHWEFDCLSGTHLHWEEIGEGRPVVHANSDGSWCQVDVPIYYRQTNSECAPVERDGAFIRTRADSAEACCALAGGDCDFEYY